MAEPEDALSFRVDKIVAHNDRYDREVYPFIVEAVRFAHEAHQSREGVEEHIDAGELLQSIRIYALCEFGPLAKQVLNHWNVNDTEDIGRIIFLLAEEGEFELKPDDRLELFRNVYDFEEALVKPFKPTLDTSPPPIPIVDVQKVTTRPGGAANVLYNIVALGGKALAFGAIGCDRHGNELKEVMAELDIDVAGVLQHDSRTTTEKMRVVASNQQVVRVDTEHKTPLSEELAAFRERLSF